MWLVATILDSTDEEHFYYHRTFYWVPAIRSDEIIYRMNVYKKRNRPRTEPWTTTPLSLEMKTKSENERQWPLSSSDPFVTRSREENVPRKRGVVQWTENCPLALERCRLWGNHEELFQRCGEGQKPT